MKKSCIKSRNKVFGKLSLLLEDVNAYMALYQRVVFEVRQEYAIEYVEYILRTFLEAAGMTEGTSSMEGVSTRPQSSAFMKRFMTVNRR